MVTQHLDILRQLKSRRPFVPFRVVTTRGERYEVSDWLHFAVPGTFVVLHPDTGPKEFVQLRSEEIAAIEELKQKPAA